jgi:hypothetical protein
LCSICATFIWANFPGKYFSSAFFPFMYIFMFSNNKENAFRLRLKMGLYYE